MFCPLIYVSQEGVAIRSGHHCTQPLHRLLGAKGSARASLYIYNTEKEVDTLVEKMHETIDFFGSFKGAQ